MSDFAGLNIGLSSLYAQRRGLEVTGQNIANANTEGYSRQRVGLVSDGGPVVPALYSRWEGAGNGVRVDDVQRLRDVFLETRGLAERGKNADLGTTATVLGGVEGVLGEPGDNGLQSMLAEFWSGFDDIANQPTELAARTQLLERAQTLATGINRSADRIGQQWSNTRTQLAGVVEEVNAAAAAVAELNRAIAAATGAGLTPNDLKDQRDLLVQRLGELAGVTARPGDNGTVDLYLGGNALVRGSRSERLAVQGAPGLTTPAGQVSVGWERDGSAAPVGSGTAGGLLKGLNDVLPRYRDEMDAVAVALRDLVNDQHRLGFDLQGAPAGDFFTGTSAATLALAVTKPEQIAASATPGAGRDGGNAGVLAEFANRAGGPDALYRQVVVKLGVESQTAQRRVDIQTEILTQVDAARESVSGVNLDEEMTNMLAYQHAYEGAARFVTAIDEMLDTLINRTGVVGR